VADDWYWFVLREEYYWLVAGGWFVVREKYWWLISQANRALVPHLMSATVLLPDLCAGAKISALASYGVATCRF
jgi:hypothetical protein